MRRACLFAMGLVVLAACGGGGGEAGSAAPPAAPSGGTARIPLPVAVDESGVPASSDGPVIAFVGVTVVSADQPAHLADHTVVVEHGLITAVAPAGGLAVPDGAVRIDGAGRYLVPGLVDAHVHLVDGDGADTDPLAALAAGVTTLRVMWGDPAHLARRDRIAAGELDGARLFVASPGLEGPSPFWPGSVVVRTDGEARAAARALAAAGYDYLKVYNSLQSGPYRAILDEARGLGIPVVGHVPAALTAELAMTSGQHSIEHFSRVAAEVTTTGAWSGSLDGSRVAAFIERTRLSATFHVPTLTVQTRTRADIAALRSSPAWNWLSPAMRAWLDSPQPQPGPARDVSGPAALRGELLLALADAGLPVPVGTDAGVQYVLPGFSIHEELERYRAAGLSPRAVLKAATLDGAAALGAKNTGRIAPGWRADLLLLAGDPQADPAMLNHRVGVMAAGRWHSQSALLAALEAPRPR